MFWRKTAIDLSRANFHQATKEAADFKFPYAGGRWDIYCNNARLVIANTKSAREAIEHAQLRAGFETRQTGKVLADLYENMKGALTREFPQFSDRLTSFSDSQHSAASTVLDIDGRLISAPLLYHMYLIMRSLTFCRPKIVCEIGGGTGGPARAWMTNGIHRPDLYINIDFAESLFYAETFLRTASPDIPIFYWHKGLELPETRPLVVLCPISNIDHATSIAADLVMNSGSMQEMSDEYVAFYMKAFDRSRWQRFYSRNYFGQPLEDRRESMNVAAPVMSREWRTVFMKMHPGESSVGTAELFFERGEIEDRGHVVKHYIDNPPSTQAELLDMFDAARSVTDAETLIEAASAAMLGMPFLPKEAVYLARKGTPSRPSAKVVLQFLEARAAATDTHATQQRGTLTGNLTGSTLTLDGAAYVLSEGYAGAVEYTLPLEDGVDVAGWTGDIKRNRPASAVVACHGDKIVGHAIPIGDRPDVMAGYGSGMAPTKFSMRVKTQAPLKKIRIFSLTEDKRALSIAMPK